MQKRLWKEVAVPGGTEHLDEVVDSGEGLWGDVLEGVVGLDEAAADEGDDAGPEEGRSRGQQARDGEAECRQYECFLRGLHQETSDKAEGVGTIAELGKVAVVEPDSPVQYFSLLHCFNS